MQIDADKLLIIASTIDTPFNGSSHSRNFMYRSVVLAQGSRQDSVFGLCVSSAPFVVVLCLLDEC